MFSYFGDSKVSTLKSGAILKVFFDSDDDKNGCVKKNFTQLAKGPNAQSSMKFISVH